jgi:hypothetical protein
VAFTTVVSGRFFGEMTDAIRKIGDRKGSFTLAMLIPTSVHPEEWNAVFSAKWLDPLSLGEAVRTLFNELRSDLSDSAISKVQRVSVLRTTESFVREITTDLGIPIQLGTAHVVQSFAFSRLGVEEAIVFAATPPQSDNPPGSVNSAH